MNPQVFRNVCVTKLPVNPTSRKSEVIYIQACPLFYSLSTVIGFDIEEQKIFRVVENSWEVAPQLVNLVCTSTKLNKLYAGFQPAQFQVVVQWLDCTCELYGLLADIGQTTTRIFRYCHSANNIYKFIPGTHPECGHPRRVRKHYHHPAKQAQRYKSQAQLCRRFASS